MTDPSAAQRSLDRQRDRLLRRLDRALEFPMVVLGFLWLALLVLDLVRGLSPGLQAVGTSIWVVFIADFLIKLVLAPGKARYLRRNWLTVIALFIPALRVFRISRAIRVFRLARATRGTRLVSVVASINRGMRALGATLRRRGFGYAVGLTLIVILAGAAGMYTFEKGSNGLDSFGTALWWTAMVMTTMGSEYWPRTPEGRLLCLFLAIYAFSIFGYFTATIATFLVGRDAGADQSELAGRKDVERLRAEIAALRRDLIRSRTAPGPGEPPGEDRHL